MEEILSEEAEWVEEILAYLHSIELVEEDDENMESDWHRLAMNLLIEVVMYFLRDRTDFYVGGNMFIFFNEEVTRKRNFRGPDFFFVWGASREPLRRYWVTYKEGGLLPNVIIELLSPRTAKEDLTTKKDVYEKVFRTRDYFCYDPDTQRLLGWHLGNSDYEALAANERGWLWVKELGLWLGTWQGKYLEREATWLRFYDARGNLLPIRAEAQEQRAEAEGQRAEAEQQRAEAVQQQLNEQRQRAEAALAELAQLKARLAKPDDSSAGQDEELPR